MVTRGTGPVRRFRISYRILFAAIVFLVLFVLASVYVINDYIERRYHEQTRSLELDRLREELKEAKRALYRSEQRIEVLETHLDRVRSTEKGVDESPEIAENPPGEKAVSEEEKPQAPEIRSDGRQVEIDELKTHRAEGKLSFSFKVVSTDKEETPIRGYVHVIAMDKTSDPPQLWTYPKTALKDGLPINYKRGHLFVIRRFREIAGECFLSSEDQVPTSLKILVYDPSGNLIYEKEFPVGPA